MTGNLIEQAADFIRENDGFTLIAHISPDGDTLGSALALYGVLKELKKDAQVVCGNRVPPNYVFLPYADELLSPEAARKLPFAISIDCADALRMGVSAPLFDAAQSTLNLDHHVTNTAYAKMNVVDGSAAATGELIYKLAMRLLPCLTEPISVCLYTALLTDTGSFAYSNTTPETMRIAADILESGIDTYEINRLVYRTVPYHKVKLLGLALNNMELLCGGRLGLTAVTLEEMRSVGATEEDTEGVIDYVRDVDSVEVAVLLREVDTDVFKASLRSKRYVDVSKISRAKNGGGHAFAAGYTAHGAFGEVYAEAVRMASAALEDEAWKVS
ncbi:MAG: bifunctional oligoribonuclease/PAP phosphatase NrnA [Clostridiaceae bacterium]|nr:bifunctional oligoribonuclease/PAP phosphatase NrnA [Eubacteriales bacterium]